MSLNEPNRTRFCYFWPWQSTPPIAKIICVKNATAKVVCGKFFLIKKICWKYDKANSHYIFSYFQHNTFLIKKNIPQNTFDTYFFSHRWCVINLLFTFEIWPKLCLQLDHQTIFETKLRSGNFRNNFSWFQISQKANNFFWLIQ